MNAATSIGEFEATLNAFQARLHGSDVAVLADLGLDERRDMRFPDVKVNLRAGHLFIQPHELPLNGLQVLKDQFVCDVFAHTSEKLPNKRNDGGGDNQRQHPFYQTKFAAYALFENIDPGFDAADIRLGGDGFPQGQIKSLGMDAGLFLGDATGFQAVYKSQLVEKHVAHGRTIRAVPVPGKLPPGDPRVRDTRVRDTRAGGGA